MAKSKNRYARKRAIDRSVSVPHFLKTENHDRATGDYNLAIYLREGKGLQVAKIYGVVTGGNGHAPHYIVSGVFDYSSIDMLFGKDKAIIVGKDFFNNSTVPRTLTYRVLGSDADEEAKELVGLVKRDYLQIRNMLPQDVIKPVVYPDILSIPLPKIDS